MNYYPDDIPDFFQSSEAFSTIPLFSDDWSNQQNKHQGFYLQSHFNDNKAPASPSYTPKEFTLEGFEFPEPEANYQKERFLFDIQFNARMETQTFVAEEISSQVDVEENIFKMKQPSSNTNNSGSTKCSNSELEFAQESQNAGFDFFSEQGFTMTFIEPNPKEEEGINEMYAASYPDSPLLHSSKKIQKPPKEQAKPKTYKEPKAKSSSSEDLLHNAFGLEICRVRTSVETVLKKGPTRGREYISEIIHATSLYGDDEFGQFIFDFGKKHRTYETVMEKLRDCPNKSHARAFCRMIEEFMSEAGKADFEEWVNMEKGKNGKTLLKQESVKNRILIRFIEERNKIGI